MHVHYAKCCCAHFLRISAIKLSSTNIHPHTKNYQDKLVKESLKIYTKVTLSYPETVTTLQRMGNLAWLESKSLNQVLTSLTV